MTVLACATGLANVPAFGADRDRDGLLVRDLRPTNVRVDAELPHHAVDDDFEVKLTHAVDQRLARLLVRANPEGRIFFSQAGQRGAHLVLVSARLRLDRDGDDRLREVDRLEHDRVARIAERVAGERVLESDDRARYRRPQPTAISSRWFACICSRRPIRSRSPLRRVQRVAARVEFAGIDAQIGQLADVRVRLDLEDQAGERLPRRRPSRITSSSVRGSMPVTGGTSSGDGR